MKAARLTALVAMAAVGLGAARPAAALDERTAAHLLVRTGHGIDPAQIRAMADLTMEQAVARLLAGVRTEPLVPMPDWVHQPPEAPDRARLQQMTPEERQAEQRRIQQTINRQRQELVGWWYREMIETDSPLTEHMTLFWHNHFTSGFDKVRFPQLMARQNALLRQHALGDFRALLHAIARDPAMILYLDNQTNRRGRPNENFARELMELFTLGEGHYTEQDIKEAARAFTGWMTDPLTGEFRFNARQHDAGPKTFFGRTGNWNGDDILNILLEQPRTAVFITEKLWRDLVSETPDPAEVERLAGIFRRSGYRIRALVEAMLLSPAFRDPANRGVLVKSPVELIVGSVRTLGLPAGDGLRFVPLARQMGQALMQPPNVKGWPGGTAWIDATTLPIRRQFLAGLGGFGSDDAAAERLRGGEAMRAARGVRRAGGRSMAAPPVMVRAAQRWVDAGMADPQRMAQILLPLDPVEPLPEAAEPLVVLRQLMLDPVYQLK